MASKQKQKTLPGSKGPNYCTKRLMTDLKEVLKHPLPSINARPLEGNLREWHCNVMAPANSFYSGTVFHLIINVPQDYPCSPPKVHLMTHLPHENTFQGWGGHYGTYVCVDMLTDKDGNRDGESQGWSPAYSIQSILVQLQAFFFSDGAQHNDNRAIKRAKNYNCKCGHTGLKPWPALPAHDKLFKPHKRRFCPRVPSGAPLPMVGPFMANPAFANHQELQAVRVSWFGGFSEDVNAHICGFLNRADLRSLSNTCRYLSRMVSTRLATRFAVEDLRCFHSKRSFKDTILGLGLLVERHADGAGLKSITPRFDLLSWECFSEHKVRQSAFNKGFTHFLPLYINPKHGRRSFGKIRECLVELVGKGGAGNFLVDSLQEFLCSKGEFRTSMVLDVLPALLNSMVVQTMQCAIHESIAALEGYCHFYHLLLAFVEQHPRLQTLMDCRLKRFLSNEEARNKTGCPNLGYLILYLLCSDRYSWADVRKDYVWESWTRQVRWFVRKEPKLDLPTRGWEAKLNTEVDAVTRVNRTAYHAVVSNRLCMFHVTFLQLFRGRGRNRRPVAAVKAMLDRNYGRPTVDMVEKLQTEVKKIQADTLTAATNGMGVYKAYFRHIGVLPRFATNPDTLARKLGEAVVSSKRRRYHYTPKPKKEGDQAPKRRLKVSAKRRTYRGRREGTHEEWNGVHGMETTPAVVPTMTLFEYLALQQQNNSQRQS